MRMCKTPEHMIEELEAIRFKHPRALCVRYSNLASQGESIALLHPESKENMIEYYIPWKIWNSLYPDDTVKLKNIVESFP